MLVLTRKLMERLYIGDDICVTVVRLEGGQVRLGIEAPREISVVRAELVPGGRGKANSPVASVPESSVQPSVPTVAGSSDPIDVAPRIAPVSGIGNRLRGPSR